MDIEGDKDASLTKKMEKKDTRKKKKETNAMPDLVEDDQLNKVEKKKKKDKKKAESYTEDSLVEDGNQPDKTEKKKKKENKKVKVGSETSNAKVNEKAWAKGVGNYQNENDEKKKKKDKRKPEVGSETNIAEIGEKSRAEGGGNNQIEKEKKKKKKISEQVLDNQSNDKIYDVEEGKYKDNSISIRTEILKDKVREELEISKENGFSQTASSAEIDNGEKQTEKKKKKKKVGRNEDENGDIGKNKSAAIEVVGNIPIDNDEKKKEKKKKIRDKSENVGNSESTAVKVVEKTTNADTDVSEKREKKRKREKNNSKDLKDGEMTTHSIMSNGQDTNAFENNSKDPKPKKKNKRVSFSGHDEVFPLKGGIVQGKRFSPKEDEMVKKAVFDYIEAHDLGEEGLSMVLHCKSHPKIKNCWKEIGEALPYRPYKSVYDRAHTLFERDMTRKWDSEELEIVRKYHTEHGSKWKQLADAMGKHRRHIKDAWRRTKLPDSKKGNWSQEEYQTLFDLVNVDLRARVNEEKKSKYGMLKDNICWMAISDTLASRNNVSCCKKWYNQLTSSMVKDGEWADTDDYHLIDALYNFDACCEEDVDWDSLLEHRSGDICRKRWKQMANHIGENGKKTFVEQVEILSKRYCPDLLEARETWDNKPRVP